jgi:hypothetical protein
MDTVIDFIKSIMDYNNYSYDYSDYEINKLDIDTRESFTFEINDDFKINNNFTKKFTTDYDISGDITAFSNNNIHYVCISCEMIECVGYINESTNDYVFVGCIGSHPFVHTSKFNYGNSDGSGPSIFESDIYNANDIHKILVKYYNAFLDNDYH